MKLFFLPILSDRKPNEMAPTRPPTNVMEPSNPNSGVVIFNDVMILADAPPTTLVSNISVKAPIAVAIYSSRINLLNKLLSIILSITPDNNSNIKTYCS